MEIGADWKVGDKLCVLDRNFPISIDQVIGVSKRCVRLKHGNHAFRRSDGKQVSPGAPSRFWSVRLATDEDVCTIQTVKISGRLNARFHRNRYPIDLLQKIVDLLDEYDKEKHPEAV